MQGSYRFVCFESLQSPPQMLTLGLLACVATIAFAATPVEIIDASGKMKTVDEVAQWAGRKIKGPGDRGKEAKDNHHLLCISMSYTGWLLMCCDLLLCV